jgi:hypothetical protein
MDVSTLSARQRANVAGLQLKRDAIRRKYGNAVQIVTTDEEAANASGWMALPLNLINTNKQVTLRMDKQVIDTLKSKKLGETRREDIPDTADVEDIVTALENSVNGTIGRVSARKPEAKPAHKVVAVPKNDVASVSDTDFIKSLLGR